MGGMGSVYGMGRSTPLIAENAMGGAPGIFVFVRLWENNEFPILKKRGGLGLVHPQVVQVPGRGGIVTPPSKGP
jgi:hypothetical protein